MGRGINISGKCGFDLKTLRQFLGEVNHSKDMNELVAEASDILKHDHEAKNAYQALRLFGISPNEYISLPEAERAMIDDAIEQEIKNKEEE